MKVTEEMVEAAARAYLEAMDVHWDELNWHIKNIYRTRIRAALEAAAAVAEREAAE